MNGSKAMGIIALTSLAAAIGLAGCKGGGPGGGGAKNERTVVLFVGSLSAQNALDRRQGILDELAGKPVPKPAVAAGPITMPAIALKPGEKPRLAFVTNASSPFWNYARAGFDKAVAETGCEAEFRIPAGGAVAEQKTILEDLVAKGVHGIAVSAVAPANQTPDLNTLAEKTILIYHDSDATASKRVLYIGTHNYLAGREAGKLIKEALGADKPIRVIDTRTDNTDRARAKSNVQDILVAHPDLDCLVGLWSYNGPAIANVLKETNLIGKVKAVSFDEAEETLQAIRGGAIYGTVVQKPYEFGYQSIKVLNALVKGDKTVIPESRVIDTGVTVVKKGNVDEFQAYLKGLLKSAQR